MNVTPPTAAPATPGSPAVPAGAPTTVAIDNLAARFGSSRVDAFATALLSQRLAGGDLAALLRRFAEGAAERDRVAEDARSATAQARFTGYLVVAMPAGAALFTEFLRPGFFGSILASIFVSLLEAYASLFVSPAQAVIVSFVVLVLTLLFRPTGLFVPTPK